MATWSRSRTAGSSSNVDDSAWATMSATAAKSSPVKPRVATAEVPRRRPEVTIGGRGSNGTVLRLTEIPISSSRISACFPVSPDSRRSTRSRWTSVPPMRTLMPSAAERVGDEAGVLASDVAERGVRGAQIRLADFARPARRSARCQHDDLGARYIGAGRLDAFLGQVGVDQRRPRRVRSGGSVFLAIFRISGLPADGGRPSSYTHG